jgi:hypothetical protein
MTTHPLPAAGLSQCDLILARLVNTPGEWVPMPALARISGAYAIHSRIADLRRRGHRIDHQNRRAGRKIHSFYRLADSSDI